MNNFRAFLKSILFGRLGLGSLYYKCIRIPLDYVLGVCILIYLIVTKKNNKIAVSSVNIGDIVYGMAYLRAFVDKSDLPVILFADSSKKRLVESYGVNFKEIKYFNKKGLLWKACQSMSRRSSLIDFAKKKGIYTLNPFFFSETKKRGRNALEILRTEQLSLPLDVMYDFPNFSNVPISSITDFEKIKNKIVVINPYSNCMAGDMEIFHRIAEVLASDGYLVYTNVMPGQKVLRGTNALDCPIYEFFAICNQIPLVVSIRSGIIDLVISANTKFVIYYWGADKNSSFNSVYDLKAWNTDNVKEIFFTNRDKAIEEFINYKRELNL